MMVVSVIITDLEKGLSTIGMEVLITKDDG